jgi:hypothetical protein
MIKRNCVGNTKCQFCDEIETIHHLSFTYSAAEYVWSHVAKATNAPNRHASFSQFFFFFESQYLTATRNVQMLVLLPSDWPFGSFAIDHALKAN